MNAEHERALALRERTGVPIEVPWRTFGIFAQAIFFVLTCIGMFALYDVTGEAGLFIGVVSLALAEYLIRVRRWFRTGVESALWLGGLFALISELPSEGKPEALLLVAAASAVAGARVRNPLFGALAAGLVMHYFEKKWDIGVLFALVAAAIAIAALFRTWRRPSTEWLWIAIALALPLAGWPESDAVWRNTTILLYATFGTIAFVAAMKKRHHAMFFASAIGFSVAAVELARDLPVALEGKLAIAGAFLMSLSLVVARTLRDRKTGFVVADEKIPAIDIAATLAMMPSADTPATTQGGGKFGGAGASGTY